MRNALLAAIAASIPLARAHIAFYDKSMWGYNVHFEDFPYDNRPEAPLQNFTFNQWWFHGHLGYPPPKDTFFELPAGDTATSQLACNLGATKFWADSEGSTDIRQNDYPCPGYPTSQFHGIDDVKGCALSIAYTSDVNSLKPEDLAIFSVNHQCVWETSTPFQIPKNMPPCPEGGCICAWHWIHSADSGSAQMFMNGFRCEVTGSTSNTPIMKPEVPKRCTGDISKCNQGAQQPMYWWQNEGNNMPNGQYDPPCYLEEWGFRDGAQNGIFGASGNNTNLSAPPSSSPPVDQPASTPTQSQPSSTPVESQPSSTSVSDKPSSTPGDNKPSSPPGDDKPTSTPAVPESSPPPMNNDPGSLSPSSTNNANDHSSSRPPHPKPTKQCKDPKSRKRGEFASRHLRNKRRLPRENIH